MSNVNCVVPAADADARKIRLLQAAAQRIRRYSVYKIMEALRGINAYTQVKAMLEQNDLWDRIVLIGVLPSDNEYFVYGYQNKGRRKIMMNTIIGTLSGIVVGGITSLALKNSGTMIYIARP